MVCFQGMDIIETLSPTAFTEYLKRYNNTICGRHPIGVLLQVCARHRRYNIPVAITDNFLSLSFIYHAHSRWMPWRLKDIVWASNSCNTPKAANVSTWLTRVSAMHQVHWFSNENIYQLKRSYAFNICRLENNMRSTRLTSPIFYANFHKSEQKMRWYEPLKFSCWVLKNGHIQLGFSTYQPWFYLCRGHNLGEIETNQRKVVIHLRKFAVIFSLWIFNK